MNNHVHPLFRDILNGFAAQPTLLARAARKAAPRRFSGESITDFTSLDEPDLRTPEERAADMAYHAQEMLDADRRSDEDQS